MPWDITIVNGLDRQRSLGTRDDVIARFAAALPGVTLQQPPGPPPEVVAEMPAILRDNLLRPRLNADLETGDLVLQFYTDDQPEIDSVGVEVRGNDNPIPALAALCQPNGWAAVNAADGEVVDLSAASAPAWEQFRAWRDHALSSIGASGTPGD